MATKLGFLRPAMSFSSAVLALALSSNAQVLTRPISDFLQNQGTFVPPPGSGCTPYNGQCLFFPPVRNYVGWTSSARAGLVDYVGLANQYLVQDSHGQIDLHTEVQGLITESRVRGETRALVDVYLVAHNALAFGFPAADFAIPPSFGYLATEVRTGRRAATADVYVHVSFLNPGGVGAPLPDLVQLLVFTDPSQLLISYEFAAISEGDLRGPSGFPEGTPGTMKIVQTGHITGSGGFVYPIERVDIAPKQR